MTEDEAKTKWCPFVRVENNKLEAAINRDRYSAPIQSLCIGSQCMAWRWKDAWLNPEFLKAHDMKDDRGGWCGLAGAP